MTLRRGEYTGTLLFSTSFRRQYNMFALVMKPRRIPPDSYWLFTCCRDEKKKEKIQSVGYFQLVSKVYAVQRQEQEIRSKTGNVPFKSTHKTHTKDYGVFRCDLTPLPIFHIFTLLLVTASFSFSYFTQKAPPLQMSIIFLNPLFDHKPVMKSRWDNDRERTRKKDQKKQQHSNIFIAVSVRHLEGQGADGCRQLVRPRSRRGSASHAPRVQHDDRHVCELWEGSPIASGRKQDVRKRDHRLGKWHRIQGRQQQHGALRVSRRRVGDVTEKEGAPVAYSNLFLQGGYSRSDDHVCLLLHWDWTGSSGRQLFSGQP